MSKNTSNQINQRLKMLYDMMPECARMGDVGTDHGFLPIYCIQTGKCGSAVASDLREGPLQTARNNIAAYGLEDRIETLLCSGLDGYRDRDCDVIVIAGMGGFTIRKILADWLALRENDKDFPGNTLFLLQPNTAEPEPPAVFMGAFFFDRGRTRSKRRPACIRRNFGTFYRGASALYGNRMLYGKNHVRQAEGKRPHLL